MHVKIMTDVFFSSLEIGYLEYRAPQISTSKELLLFLLCSRMLLRERMSSATMSRRIPSRPFSSLMANDGAYALLA